MPDLPPDIMDAARKAHAEFADSRVSKNLTFIIAEAINAERERCAGVADGFNGINPQAAYIAVAIRKGAV